MLSPITPNSREEWRRDLQQIKSLGFNTVREWVDWSHNEPQEGKYNFENLRLLLRVVPGSGPEGLHPAERNHQKQDNVLLFPALLGLSPVGDVASAVENALAAHSGTTAAPHEYFDQTSRSRNKNMASRALTFCAWPTS
jgi:hypothetical protein